MRPVWLFPVIALVAALVVGAITLVSLRPAAPDGVARSGPVRVSGEARIGGPFTLVDQDGRTVTDADFRGRAMLVYFGFTYCPDVCPYSLQIMDAALERLSEAERARFQPILITVDPERDTPEALREYVAAPAFPDGLIGLTGTPDQIREAARAYRVYYARVDDDGTLADYTMDHSSIVYLMDETGAFADLFPHDTSPEVMADRLKAFLEGRDP